MRRTGFAVTPLLVLAMALAAAAQTPDQDKNLTTLKEMERTVRIVVSGRVVLDFVYRSSGVTFATEGFTSVDVPPTPPTDDSDTETSFEGHVAIRTDIDLSDRVSIVLEIGTLRVDGGVINEWGNTTAEGIQLREAHAVVSELLTPELKAQIGIATWSFDVRGRGNSFAFDPRHSSTIAKNQNRHADDSDVFTNRASNGTAGPNELVPLGAVLTWARENIMVDLVILPGVIEGGNPSNDEALYAVDFWYKLDQLGKGSRVGAIFSISAFDIPGATFPDDSQTNTALYTLGGGIVLKEVGMPGLELYFEVYVQFGDAGQSDTGGTPDAEDIEADGNSFQLGGEYHSTVGNPLPWWVGANVTYISGDDDSPAGTDDTSGNFLSYENVNDLLILEDMYFGFDWDANYFAFKFSAGASFDVASGKDNLEVSAILGIARAAEDVVISATTKEDGLGNEVDLRARYHLSKQASFNVAIGFLFGSDLLEESMRAHGDPDEEDSAQIFTLGTDLKF